VSFLRLDGLAMSGCDFHPSTADDARMAAAVERALDAQPGLWSKR
jgi:hypothetical protein